MDMMSTANKNMKILALLCNNAIVSLLDSPIYRVIFKILNTLSNRIALTKIKA